MDYFIDQKWLYHVMSSLAHKFWGKDDLVEVLMGGYKGLSLFLLSDIGAMNSVLVKVPWHILNKKFVLKRWHPGMSLSRSCIKVAAQKVPP